MKKDLQNSINLTEKLLIDNNLELTQEGRNELEDRKSVVQGKSVDLGGRRSIKKKKDKKKKKKKEEEENSGEKE